MMQWSKLKKSIERFFAPSVAGRVELRATSYHSAPDQTGRGYITVDGEEVWNMCTLKFYPEERAKIDARMAESGVSARQAQIEIGPELRREGILAQWDFYQSLTQYSSQSIEENLSSQDALIKSLAMLDARTGRRRLAQMSLANDHPMVRYFHNFRMEAEKRDA